MPQMQYLRFQRFQFGSQPNFAWHAATSRTFTNVLSA